MYFLSQICLPGGFSSLNRVEGSGSINLLHYHSNSYADFEKMPMPVKIGMKNAIEKASKTKDRVWF